MTGRNEESELSKKLYVGNLPFSATEEEIRDLFGQHGSVESVNVITDRETGRARGFAFVEMDASAADAAMRALDGSQLGGRSLRVNEANERRGGGGGGGGGGRGGGGGGYRGGRY
jgi:RNA recognition motif-containing protein